MNCLYVRLLASIICLSLLVLGSGAIASPLIQVLGSSSRTVDMETATSTHRPLEFAVKVQKVDETSKVVTELVGFTRDDRVLDFGPEWVDFVPHPERADRAMLKLNIPAERLAEAGSYALTVAFWKQTQADPGAIAAPVNSDEDSLTLSLNRPAGTLTLEGPIRIERVIHIPYYRSKLIPSSLLFSETSGRNFVQLLSPGTDNKAKVQLRSSANSETVAYLGVALPGTIQAAGQKHADVELLGDTPVGSLNGSLRIISDQLQSRTLTTALEVVTRLHRFWLVAVILTGVLIGFIVRVNLEGSKKKKMAEAAARRVRNQFKATIEQVVDDAYKSELETALSELSKVIDKKRSSVEALNKARETAANKLTEVLDKLEAARDELDQKISAAQVDLGSPEDYVFEVGGLEAASEFITQARTSMQKGDISRTLRSFDSELSKKLQTIVSSLDEVTNRLAHAARSTKDWPELDVAQVLEDLRGKITDIQQGLTHLKTTDQIGSRIRELNFTLRSFAQRYLNERAPSIQDHVYDILKGLHEVPPCRDLPEVKLLNQSFDDFKQLSGIVGSADLEKLLEDETKLYTTVGAALKKSADKVGADISNLAEGEHRAAVELVRTAFGVAPLGSPAPKITPTEEELVQPDEKGWMVTVSASSVPRAGIPLTLSAKIVVEDGSAQPSVFTTTWNINGALQPSSGPGGLNCIYSPGQDETELVIEVTINGGPPENRTATGKTTMRVRPSRDREIAAQLEAEAAAISGLQTAVAGVVIVFAGYAIFQSAFVGSFVDISSALFWGFGVDISLAKALEYSSPLTSKKLPQA